LVDEIAEETVLRTVTSKDATAAPVAVTETQQPRRLMPHDAVEPSNCMLLCEIFYRCCTFDLFLQSFDAVDLVTGRASSL